MTYLTLVPAYGRDYPSAKAVREAWAGGADFRVATVGPDEGRVCNRESGAGRAPTCQTCRFCWK